MQGFGGEPEERDRLEEVGKVEKILKLIIKLCDVRMWTRFI
jgi:hypothetical protein